MIKIGDTRWNSKFYAIRRAHWLIDDIRDYLLENDFELAARFTSAFPILQFCAVILEPFEKFTLMVQSEASDTLSLATVWLKKLFDNIRRFVEWSAISHDLPPQCRRFLKKLEERIPYHFADSKAAAAHGTVSELGWRSDIALKAVFLNPSLKDMKEFDQTTAPGLRFGSNRSLKEYIIEGVITEVVELQRAAESAQNEELRAPEPDGAPVQGEDEMELDDDGASSSSWFEIGENFTIPAPQTTAPRVLTQGTYTVHSLG
jgi:hypothetical protein